MEIKDRVKAVRKSVGVTQTKFANRIAVAPSYISEIENGVREINERAIRLIMAEFNVSEDWLRTGQGTMFNEDVSTYVSEAMGKFKSLDKQFQEVALNILDELVEINRYIKQGKYPYQK